MKTHSNQSIVFKDMARNKSLPSNSSGGSSLSSFLDKSISSSWLKPCSKFSSSRSNLLLDKWRTVKRRRVRKTPLGISFSSLFDKSLLRMRSYQLLAYFSIVTYQIFRNENLQCFKIDVGDEHLLVQDLQFIFVDLPALTKSINKDAI